MKVKNTWQIECAHTPETIDRILLPIRKRGLSVLKLLYEKSTDETASCSIEFETEEADAERVYKNMIRLQDIKSVIRK
ncbi:MAG: hypothetical protein MUE33_01390 [Cytophagaceae bacterium]|jgi:acetolactate synthase II small subunit|nr:hypothetical protein [Cytophagaceae bacterium]